MGSKVKDCLHSSETLASSVTGGHPSVYILADITVQELIRCRQHSQGLFALQSKDPVASIVTIVMLLHITSQPTMYIPADIAALSANVLGENNWIWTLLVFLSTYSAQWQPHDIVKILYYTLSPVGASYVIYGIDKWRGHDTITIINTWLTGSLITCVSSSHSHSFMAPHLNQFMPVAHKTAWLFWWYLFNKSNL